MRSRAMRYFAYTLEIIIFFILEQTPDILPTLNGITPILIVPVLVMIALFEGENIGLIFGSFVGVLLDASFSWNIGFYTVVMSVCGYVIGLVARSVVKSNFSTAMIISAITIFSIYTLHFIFCYAVHEYGYGAYTFLYHYVPKMIYTMLISPFMYFFTRTFAVCIRKPEK